jgi:paraquat-inducible protein A
MTEPAPDVIAASAVAPRAAARRQAALAARPDLVVCQECDAVHERIELARGTVARCRRCNALLGRGHVLRTETLLAFSVASLLLIVIGNSAPIVTLDLRGVISRATLPEAIEATWQAGQPLVAVLTAATALVFPLCFTVLRLYLLGSLVRGVVPRGFVPAMHMLAFVTRWGMVEVFLMGTLVAVVRCASLTAATPGIGLLAYAAVTLLLTSITAAGTHGLWKKSSELGMAS